MNDLKLGNDSHDLVVEGGDLILLNSDAMVARQACKINLLFFLGEWFLDLEYGVPYFQSILKKGSTKNLVDAIIRSKILASYKIETIVSFRSSIVNQEHYIVESFQATTTDGEIISLTNQKLF